MGHYWELLHRMFARAVILEADVSQHLLADTLGNRGFMIPPWFIVAGFLGPLSNLSRGPPRLRDSCGTRWHTVRAVGG